MVRVVAACPTTARTVTPKVITASPPVIIGRSSG
jgi:hypothetical protein